jgi:hypothetical protein
MEQSEETVVKTTLGVSTDTSAVSPGSSAASVNEG